MLFLFLLLALGSFSARADSLILQGFPVPPPFTSSQTNDFNADLLYYASQIEEYKMANRPVLESIAESLSTAEYVSTNVYCTVRTEATRLAWEQVPGMKDLSEAVLTRILAYLLSKDRSQMDPIVLFLGSNMNFPPVCEVRLEGWNTSDLSDSSLDSRLKRYLSDDSGLSSHSSDESFPGRHPRLRSEQR